MRKSQAPSFFDPVQDVRVTTSIFSIVYILTNSDWQNKVAFCKVLMFETSLTAAGFEGSVAGIRSSIKHRQNTKNRRLAYLHLTGRT